MTYGLPLPAYLRVPRALKKSQVRDLVNPFTTQFKSARIPVKATDARTAYASCRASCHCAAAPSFSERDREGVTDLDHLASR